MPPGRNLRPKAVSNENEGNGATTRSTRAKAAVMTTDPSNVTAASQKPSLSKKSNGVTMANQRGTAAQRKRPALGDVSNVAKPELVEAKEVKRALGNTKVGLVSKASQVAGVQKGARMTASRVGPGIKETGRRVTTAELKRSANSGSGVMGAVQKKRQIATVATQRALKEGIEEGAAAAAAALDDEPLETTKTTTTTTTTATTRAFTVEVDSRDRIQVHEDTPPEDVDEEESAKASQPQQDEEAPTKAKRAIEDPAPAAAVKVDAADVDDPLLVAEYATEIFEYLLDLEEKTLPNPDYMDHQEELEWKMRGILVDWLIEVHARFYLLPETLFLTVNIIDRFLSLKVVQLDRLQLVGVTAMFIASKYEEVLTPHVANFRHVADDGFSVDEILSTERYMLSALNYDLSYPNPMDFLRRISKADNYDIRTRTLGKYMVEISLLDHRFMRYRQSHLAAAAMYLAWMILDRGEWNVHLRHCSGYTEEELEPIVRLMIHYLAQPVQHEAFFKKYACKKYLKASIFSRQWAKKYFALESTVQSTRDRSQHHSKSHQ